MLTIMAAFAQLERDTMIERTRAGLAAAAANGRKGGRPRKVGDAHAEEARSLRDKGISATDIGKMLGVSRAHRVSAPFRRRAARCVDAPRLRSDWSEERPLAGPTGKRSSYLNRPGMSGDSTSWEGWSHVRKYVEALPVGAAGAGGTDGRRDQ
jgi:hypothetical protein